jgi:hypothetical protein
MARFNPIEFYNRQSASGSKPLSVSAPRTRYRSPSAPPPSALAQGFGELSKFATRYFKEEADKSDREKMREILMAYMQGTPGEKKIIDLPESEIMEQYGKPAYEKVFSGTTDIFDAEDPADRVERAHVTAARAMPELDDEGRRFTQERLEGLAAARHVAGSGRLGQASEGMLNTLMMDTMKQARAKRLLGEEREHEKEKAAALALSKIKAARAKPGTDPNSYKEWKLSGSNLSYEEWLQKRDLQKIGLRRGESGEPPTAIPGGPADIKQQRLKLQTTSNALLARRVELMELKSDPDYIAKIEKIRKSAGYLIDLKKSRPKAEGALKTLEMKAAQVQGVINDALPLARSIWSAGFGVVLKGVPESSSRKLAGLLIQLRAIIGFDTLAEMRANSPTGGALGQVSNIEINLLQAVKGTLDQGQRETLVRSLEHISKNYPKLVELGRTRFRKQYAPLEKQPDSSPKVIRFDAKGNIIP